MATHVGRPAQRQYHYVMTMQAPGGSVCTRDGTLTVDIGAQDATRYGAFRHVHDLVAKDLGRAGAVLLWSFEPNEL
ncbi:hypothetical protein ACIRL3_40575 [Streptomyces sp. NPDC102384]|uniref:hypothetical protein n=1 Tax=Streptomyces sp. NPDC102384 TaxID=3366166 RepID=UPI003805CAC4